MINKFSWLKINNILVVKNNHYYQKDILAIIRDLVSTDFFPKNGDKFGVNQTIKIKYNLTKLGLMKGYWVYANRLGDNENELHNQQKGFVNQFKNREWLFDLHWYKESLDKHYTPTDFTLAVECEWGNKRKDDKSGLSFSAIKYDFQKLLFSNARLKLMIFRVSKLKNDEFVLLDNYFQDAINTFSNLKNKSPFLFICFYKKNAYYSEKYKNL